MFTTRFSLLCTAVISLSGIGNPVPPPRFPFSVDWKEDLKLTNLSGLKKALSENVAENAMELVNDVGSREMKTCDEYLEARKDGYTARVTPVMKEEIRFRQRCRTLEVLQTARGARRSFVRPLAIAPELLGFLPPTLAFSADAEEIEAERVAEARGASWAQHDPQLVAEKDEGETLVVRDAERTRVHTLEVLAKGDFDGDGIDDLLVAVYQAADTGSYRSHHVVILTRENAKSRLRVVRVVD